MYNETNGDTRTLGTMSNEKAPTALNNTESQTDDVNAANSNLIKNIYQKYISFKIIFFKKKTNKRASPVSLCPLEEQ